MDLQNDQAGEPVNELAAMLDRGALVTDEMERAYFAQDYFNRGPLPEAVLQPSGIEELSRVIGAATAKGLAVYPRGGGYSYTDGYLVTKPGITIDMRSMNRVIEIKDGHIVADPGPRPPDGQAALAAQNWTARAGRISHLGDVVEAAKTALRALRANVFRAVLTLLGIVIGVASVIAMLAIGDGAKQVVIDRISAMGSNLLLVRPGAPNQRGFQNIATLVLADVHAIDKEVPNVLAAVPEQSSTATLRFGESDYSSSVRGTSTPARATSTASDGSAHPSSGCPTCSGLRYAASAWSSFARLPAGTDAKRSAERPSSASMIFSSCR